MRYVNKGNIEFWLRCREAAEEEEERLRQEGEKIYWEEEQCFPAG